MNRGQNCDISDWLSMRVYTIYVKLYVHQQWLNKTVGQILLQLIMRILSVIFVRKVLRRTLRPWVKIESQTKNQKDLQKKRHWAIHASPDGWFGLEETRKRRGKRWIQDLEEDWGLCGMNGSGGECRLKRNGE